MNFRALARDTTVDLAGVTDPETLALLARLDAEGVEVLVKPAATDFGFTNLYVVGADRDPDAGNPLMAAACGEAAHPDREVALRKALLEFAAARVRLAFTHGPLGAVERATPPRYLEVYTRRHSLAGEEERALQAMIDWTALPNGAIRAALADTVLAARGTTLFTALPTLAAPLADRAALTALVIERLTAAGFDILYADCSPPDAPDVRVIKAIVPGLEVETMSYGRIGARNLRRLLDRGSDIAGLGDPPPGALPIRLTERRPRNLRWHSLARPARDRATCRAALRPLPRAESTLCGAGPRAAVMSRRLTRGDGGPTPVASSARHRRLLSRTIGARTSDGRRSTDSWRYRASAGSPAACNAVSSVASGPSSRSCAPTRAASARAARAA